jgi:ketosteroid isomerase-like protein
MTDEAGIRGKAALRAASQKLFSQLVHSHASPTDLIIEGHTLVAALHVEGQTTDGQPIAMHNLSLWTFEHGKFKVLRIYMDTYPYRQALRQVWGSRDT